MLHRFASPALLPRGNPVGPWAGELITPKVVKTERLFINAIINIRKKRCTALLCPSLGSFLLIGPERKKGFH